VILRILRFRIVIVAVAVLIFYIRRYTLRLFGWLFPSQDIIKRKVRLLNGSMSPANDVIILRKSRARVRGSTLYRKMSSLSFVASGKEFMFVQFENNLQRRRVVPRRIPSPNSQSHYRKPNFQAKSTNRTVVRCRILNNAKTSYISHDRCYETDKENSNSHVRTSI
jgi:hypothetical protein